MPILVVPCAVGLTDQRKMSHEIAESAAGGSGTTADAVEPLPVVLPEGVASLTDLVGRDSDEVVLQLTNANPALRVQSCHFAKAYKISRDPTLVRVIYDTGRKVKQITRR
jgi:hypothetical protein